MYVCKLCNHSSGSLKRFSEHFSVHRNVVNFDFPCGVPGCNRTFRNYSSFKTHVHRDHQPFSRKKDAQFFCVSTWNCPLCAVKCEEIHDILSHLRVHIKHGVEIRCPFANCKKRFSVRSSFASHISRVHNKLDQIQLDSTSSETGTVLTESAQENNQEFPGRLHSSDEESVTDDEVDVSADSFKHSLSLFYLKLEAKLLLPNSTIQEIIDTVQDIHALSQQNLIPKLKKKLEGIGITDDEVTNVLTLFKSEDLFSASNCKEFRSESTRKSHFKAVFDYVSPTEIYLGEDQFGKQRFCQYIKIQDTLRALFKQNSFIKDYKETHKAQPALQRTILRDVYDGRAFPKDEPLHKNSAVTLILYQDSFEVVNPLGSGKKKHKILAVYATLADIQPYNRSNIDHMQLVLLCNEQDYKEFGASAVFSRLISDLQSLEDSGIILDDETCVKGTLLAIAGDNLGSHNIGGFTENFSTSHFFCRYCIIRRDSFRENPLATGSIRTEENYKQALHPTNTDENVIDGVKFDSIFNKVTNFHVCKPGLPPCLGHDLFEGIVSVDLSLFICNLVKVKKYFTYEQLNRSITQFTYLGSDVNNKPCTVNVNGKKLGGHAVQNWCLLRLLPVIVGNRIKNPVEDNVWQLCLKLREIVELICASVISTNQIAYLQVLIEEYISDVCDIFPEYSLKPKHHFVLHYPWLISQFGPLIRLWTLRFESKHTFFKQCCRKLQNFKNVCKTLAHKHQLLQAYLGAGFLFPPTLIVEKSLPFAANACHEKIKTCISNCSFYSKEMDVHVAHRVTYKGTTYKKGMFVVLGRSEDELVVGQIELALIHMDSLYFVTQVHNAVRLIDLGVYDLVDNPGSDSDREFRCVAVEKLLDFYPLPMYSAFGCCLIPLHHAVVDE